MAPLAGYAQSPSFKVAVQGELKPAACTMQVSEQGSFNYGKLKLKDLNKDTYTLLPVLERELRISCEARTKVALTASDPNAGLVPFKDPIVFSAGMAAGPPVASTACATGRARHRVLGIDAGSGLHGGRPGHGLDLQRRQRQVLGPVGRQFLP